MTQEEKAKRYDEALERAKHLKENTDSVGAKDISYTYEYIFPELKESEDERIRKALVEEFEKKAQNGFEWKDSIPNNAVLAWLEKQGEQKPKKVSIWKHWKNGIAGNGEGEPIYLIKDGYTYSISSCLCFECDYIELSELDKLLSESKVSRSLLGVKRMNVC